MFLYITINIFKLFSHMNLERTIYNVTCVKAQYPPGWTLVLY